MLLYVYELLIKTVLHLFCLPRKSAACGQNIELNLLANFVCLQKQLPVVDHGTKSLNISTKNGIIELWVSEGKREVEPLWDVWRECIFNFLNGGMGLWDFFWNKPNRD